VALVVAQQIVRDTVRQNLQAGDMLPSEKSMLEQYEIGRGTLREALRFLEFQGMISLKPGPRGGPVLRDPDSAHLASTMVLLMQLQGASLSSIVQVRTALEPIVTGLAASQITEESLEKLQLSLSQMSNALEKNGLDEFLESNRLFHETIAWSTGNPMFGYLVDSLLGITGATVISVSHPAKVRAATYKAHLGIYEALSAHDGDLSTARMRSHIDDYVKYAEQKFPEVLSQVLPWSQALGQ
jgi:DNA-binding FadR family transcriptional regulator